MRLVKIEGHWVNPDSVCRISEAEVSGRCDIEFSDREQSIRVVAPASEVVRLLTDRGPTPCATCRWRVPKDEYMQADLCTAVTSGPDGWAGAAIPNCIAPIGCPHHEPKEQ